MEPPAHDRASPTRSEALFHASILLYGTKIASTKLAADSLLRALAAREISLSLVRVFNRPLATREI